MGAPRGNQTEFLDHFQLDTDPFSSEQEVVGFFNAFNLDPGQPVTLEQAIVYIRFVLTAAGPENKIIIEEGAYQELYRLTAGKIGRIKTIMDKVIHKAFKDRVLVINTAYVEDAFMELSRGNGGKRPSIKIVGLILIALILICIGSVLVLQKSNIEVPEKKSETQSTKPASLIATAPPPSLKKAQKKPVQYSDKQVMDFLSAYNLEVYEPLFFSAIVSENFKEITQRIYNETGFRLIHFTALPEMVESRYEILKKTLLNPVHTRYFLFWKPTILIPAYDNGVKGESIRQLQAGLKKLGLYNKKIDGRVDTELTRALIRFQRQRSLEQTGFPDPVTLFFLTALSQ